MSELFPLLPTITTPLLEDQSPATGRIPSQPPGGLLEFSRRNGDCGECNRITIHKASRVLRRWKSMQGPMTCTFRRDDEPNTRVATVSPTHIDREIRAHRPTGSMVVGEDNEVVVVVVVVVLSFIGRGRRRRSGPVGCRWGGGEAVLNANGSHAQSPNERVHSQSCWTSDRRTSGHILYKHGWMPRVSVKGNATCGSEG